MTVGSDRAAKAVWGERHASSSRSRIFSKMRNVWRVSLEVVGSVRISWVSWRTDGTVLSSVKMVMSLGRSLMVSMVLLVDMLSGRVVKSG